MPRRWKPEDIQTMVRMRRYGRTFVEIGEYLGKKPNTVCDKYNRVMGLKKDYRRRPSPDPKPEKPRQLGVHLISYNRARRGFHVPREQERQYFELLREGVPIAEAARQLGLSPRSNP